jgi:outer membrane protein OmpA-like peptidoglycan-associated protein
MWVAATFSGSLPSSRALALPDASALELRLQAGAASFFSRDQVDLLHFDSLGIVGAVQLGYSVLPWLDLRVSLAGAGFPAPERTGGLLAPQLGAAVRLASPQVRPWLQVDVGMGRTGALLKPVLNLSVGIDLNVSRAFALGPVLGYSQVFHHDAPFATSDACFLWFGAALSARPWVPELPVATDIRARDYLVERVTVIQHTPPVSHDEPPLDAELDNLLSKAAPVARREWLAPILFGPGSAALDPQGLAMLHEVLHELSARVDIKQVEIQGYADARGDSDFNLQLSEQRARVVLEWLVGHGIKRERLRVAPRGATNFVQQGETEEDHAQNRRVVFRVIEEAQVHP